MIGSDYITLSHCREAGEGGMGVVYKAQDTKLNRLVVHTHRPTLFDVVQKVVSDIACSIFIISAFGGQKSNVEQRITNAEVLFVQPHEKGSALNWRQL